MELLFKLLLTGIACVNVIQLFRGKGVFTTVIVGMQFLATGAFYFSSTISLFLYSLFPISAFLVAVYGIMQRAPLIKGLILGVALPSFLYHLIEILHYPYFGIVGRMQIVPVLTFVFLIAVKRDQFKKERGFLLFIAVDALYALLLRFEMMY